MPSSLERYSCSLRDGDLMGSMFKGHKECTLDEGSEDPEEEAASRGIIPYTAHIKP